MTRSFSAGIIKENPLFVLLLGLCPALAVTTRVDNALALGAATLFVLVFSNLTISLLRGFIPDKVRVPADLVIIAAYTTIIDLVLQTYEPLLSGNLGIFVPLITVNCLILGRARAFAKDHPAAPSFIDGLGEGLGFAFALAGIALLREVLGAGTITLFAFAGFDGTIEVPGLSGSPVRVIGLSAGAFLVMGYLKALVDLLSKRASRAKKRIEE